MKLVYDVGEKIQYGFSCASPLRERWSKVAAAVATKFNPPPSEAVDYSASARVEPIPKLILTELWKDDKARVGNGMKHLANLCFHDDNHNHNNRQANRQAVYEAGGIATVVGAMIKWDQNAAITAEGCRTLHNVTMDNLVYQDSAVKVGALEIVLAAMRRFTNDRYIQRVGCGALHALSKNSLNHAMHLIIELDGMRAMVSCMKAFPDSRRLQMWACFAMEDISRWEMLKDHLVDAGALVALAAAIETYREMETSESLAIQEKARSAMKRLSSTAAIQSRDLPRPPITPTSISSTGKTTAPVKKIMPLRRFRVAELIEGCGVPTFLSCQKSTATVTAKVIRQQAE